MSIADEYYDKTINAWKRDDVANAAFLAASQHPIFGAAAPDLMDSVNLDTFHYRLFNEVMKRDFGMPDTFKRIPRVQRRGTCGGQGNAGAIDMMNAYICYMYGFKFPGFVSPASQYAGARVEIGNHPGSWDGAVGVHLAQTPVKLGTLLLSDTIKSPSSGTGAYSQALNLQDEQLAVAWANSRAGVPDSFNPLLKSLLIQESIPVTSPEEAGKAIQNCNLVVNGSTLIPDGRRGTDGISPVRSAGGHWTFFGDVRWSKSNPNLIHSLLYYNSWDTTWGTGTKYPDDMPDGAVWVDRSDVQSMLAQRDAYALIRPMGLTYTGQYR